jgi:hypothetical protein
MYTTEDYYEVSLKDVKIDEEKYTEMAEKYGIDNRFPYEAITDMICGNQHITGNTYEYYKKLLFILYKLVGAFSIEILFTEDEAPFGCQPNAEFSFDVNANGEALFHLKNIIEIEDDGDDDCQQMKDEGYVLFENDKSLEINLSDLNMEQFLAITSDDE